MIKLLFQQLKYYFASSLLFIIAFVSIFIVLPVALLSVSNANEQVETDVTYYARGSYDILVRAEGNKHPLEEELGIVPENYIGFGNGGISIEVWKQIKDHPHIEVAAPVASLGYFTGLNSNVGLEMTGESSSYSVQFYTTDGINEYPISKFLECIHLEPSGELPPHFISEDLFNDPSLLNYCYNAVQFQLPTTYQLLVAIDPIEEEKLTGVHYHLDDKGWGSYYLQQLGKDTNRAIPVLEIVSTGPSLIGQFEINTLPIDSAMTKQLRQEAGLNDYNSESGPYEFIDLFNSNTYTNLYEKIKQLTPEKTYHLDLDFSEHLRGFFHETFYIKLNGEVEISELGAMGGNYVRSNELSHSTIYYTAGHPKYEKVNGRYYIPKLGELDGVPIYREVNENGMSYQELIEKQDDELYILDPIERVTVEPGTLELSSSPLGIYQFAPVYHIDEETGEKTLLTPTITPGSFVTSPASGVTHIDYVEILKGDEPPIDAIRVRVAGIESYDEAAKEKIDQISQWIESLGLEATIVAGASPQILTVEVEDVGLVEEAWTTLGAAGQILSLWNLLSITFSILFFVVMILYIYNRFSFWQVSKSGDLKLFEQLGWSKRHIYQINTLEMIILLIMSIIFAVIGTYFIQEQLGDERLYFWLIISVVIVFSLVLVLSYFKLYRFSSKTELIKQSRRNNLTRRVKSYILKNILFFRAFITPSFIQLIIASYLSTIVFMMINKTKQETNLTLLGQYINLETENWQYILIIATVVLTVITVIETTISIVKQRNYEFRTLKTIGWEYKDILTLFMKESSLWCIAAIIFGLLMTIGTYAFFYTVNFADIAIVIMVGVGLLSIILITISLILSRLIKKI